MCQYEQEKETLAQTYKARRAREHTTAYPDSPFRVRAKATHDMALALSIPDLQENLLIIAASGAVHLIGNLAPSLAV